MSDLFDGFSNIDSLTARINALKNSQENSPAAAASDKSAALDPDTFILETQKNFNQMLNSLMAPADNNNDGSGSSDPFSFMTDSNQSALQAQIEKMSNAAGGTQNLAVLGEHSPLLGQKAIYQNSAGAQNAGVVEKILIERNGQAVVVLDNGQKIPAADIIGLQK
jgi:hypothetical protein